MFAFLFYHYKVTILLKLNIKNKKSHILESNNNFGNSPYEIVKEDINKVNKFIITKLKSDVPLIPIMSEHLLQSGGKRIRPNLTLLFSKLFGYHLEIDI